MVPPQGETTRTEEYRSLIDYTLATYGNTPTISATGEERNSHITLYKVFAALYTMPEESDEE